MTDENALIARAARGETEALGALLAAHRPTVVRIARHLVGDAATAEDVAQDVLVRLQASLPGFRGEAALSTWLYRVTLNLCRDHLRRSRRHGADLGADGAAIVELAGASADAEPDHRLDLRRARRAVRAAIDRLPAPQKEAIVLRYLEDLSYSEIARLTATPQGTVASRVFRALERLGREIEPRHAEVVK